MSEETNTGQAGSSERDVAVAEFIENIETSIEESDQLQMDRYGFGAWSISKLKVLQKCPFQFYLKYVLKIKVPEIIGGRQETLSADVGSAAHRILELVMKSKSISESFALTKKEFVGAGCSDGKLTEEQWVEHVENLEMAVSAFKDRMEAFSRRNPIKRVFTEMRIGVTKDWEPCAFFDKDAYFRGIVDLCIQLENGDLIIIDHKTGGGEGSLRPYETQLNSYKPLFHYGIDKIAGSQSAIHFIRAQDVRMSQYHNQEEIEGKLRRALEWEFSGAVDTVTELGYFKHICGSYCKWCEYASVCKAPGKPLLKAEKATKRVIPIAKA
jgi:hypothetical protein